MKHDPEKKRESEGKGKGSRPSSSQQRNSMEEGIPTGKNLSGKENQATCFAKEMLVLTGIHLSVPFTNKGVANWGLSGR